MKIMKAPRSLDLSITSGCNLRCRYCSHFEGAGDVGHDLPKEEWLRFFRELNHHGIMSIVIGGGEPFVRDDLSEIIAGIVQNRMRFSINTNGTLITEAMAGFLVHTRRCDYVQVSIDGPSAKGHDECRGEGSFERAIEGIKRLRRYHVQVTVRVTVHRYNVGDLEETAGLLLEDLGLPGFSTNSASHLGRCRHNADDLQLSVEERSLAMEKLLELNERYNGRISADAGPLAEAMRWQWMVQARDEGKEGRSGGGYLSGCSKVFEGMAVRADGVMVPCVQMSHIELGRINQDDLADIWQHHPGLAWLRERQDIPLSDFAFCNGCEYANYCTGNCPALAYTTVGDENHPSPDACMRLFLEQGGRFPNAVP